MNIIVVDIFLQACIFSSFVLSENDLYPKNPRQTIKEFRTIGVVFDKIKNFNASGTADQEFYIINYRLKYTPPYFQSHIVLDIIPGRPNIIVEGLLLNTTLQFSAATKFYRNNSSTSYSPPVSYSTRLDPNVEVVLPGPVLGISIDVEKTLKVINKAVCVISWDTPSNIQQSRDKHSKSIQYTITLCFYNPLIQKMFNCSAVSQVVAQSDQIRQSTKRSRYSFYITNITAPTNRDIAFIVTPIALNGKEGPTAMSTKRIDPSSEPPVPNNLRYHVKDINTIQLSWESIITNATFRIAYHRINSRENYSFVVINQTTTTLYDLTAATDYLIRVAVDDSMNGTSQYSHSIILNTEDRTSSSLLLVPMKAQLLLLVSCLCLFKMTFGGL